VEGLITDYKADMDEHAIAYDINTPAESYEWFSVRRACVCLRRTRSCPMRPAALPARGRCLPGGLLRERRGSAVCWRRRVHVRRSACLCVVAGGAPSGRACADLSAASTAQVGAGGHRLPAVGRPARGPARAGARAGGQDGGRRRARAALPRARGAAARGAQGAAPPPVSCRPGRPAAARLLCLHRASRRRAVRSVPL